MPPRKLMPDVIVCIPGITGSVLRKDGQRRLEHLGRRRVQRAEDARRQTSRTSSSRTTRSTWTTSTGSGPRR